ncbi:hypothetical protein D3C73_1319560 [compost metagenome]
MRGQHVVARCALHSDELVLGGGFAGVQDLNAVLLPVGQVHEDGLEVADALRSLQHRPQGVGVAFLQAAFPHIHDEPRMGAVDVVAAAKQGRVLVQEG